MSACCYGTGFCDECATPMQRESARLAEQSRQAASGAWALGMVGLTAQTGAVRRLYSTVELDEKRDAVAKVLKLVEG